MNLHNNEVFKIRGTNSAFCGLDHSGSEPFINYYYSSRETNLITFAIYIQLVHLRSRVTSDWPMEALLTREESKCVIVASGGLFMMTVGIEMMLEWLVDSWDFPHGVRDNSENHIS